MIKSTLIFIILLFLTVGTYAQEDIRQVADTKKTTKKWVSSAYIDLIHNYKNTYTYYDANNKIQEPSISKRGAIEFVYNLDYHLFKRFAIVGIGGVNNFITPSSSSLKVGLGFKFFHTKNKSHYLTLQYGYSIPFNRKKFREGHQIKIGEYFDVTRLFNQRLIVGLFYNYDFLYLDGSKPLYLDSNRPFSIEYHSIGISLGLKFK